MDEAMVLPSFCRRIKRSRVIDILPITS
jgi:hypothetical protein